MPFLAYYYLGQRYFVIDWAMQLFRVLIRDTCNAIPAIYCTVPVLGNCIYLIMLRSKDVVATHPMAHPYCLDIGENCVKMWMLFHWPHPAVHCVLCAICWRAGCWWRCRSRSRCVYLIRSTTTKKRRRKFISSSLLNLYFIFYIFFSSRKSC